MIHVSLERLFLLIFSVVSSHVDGKVLGWLALLPHNNKVTGLNPGWDHCV